LHLPISSKAENGSQSLAIGGNVYGDVNQIIQYGEQIKVGNTELQTMMIDYGAILIKFWNKTGYTLYNCYAEITAVKWEGDSYFSHHEIGLFG
jgi:hypothetical protein